MSDELYKKLIGSDREIPWTIRAEHFMMLKIASGGLERDEAVALTKLAQVTEEEAGEMVRRGILGGIRSGAAGDVAHVARMRRTKGERVGKAIGTAAGAALPLLLTRGRGGSTRALASLVGAAAGRGVGQLAGQASDVSRTKSRYNPEKRATIVKAAALTSRQKSVGVGAGVGAGAGALAGLGLHAARVREAAGSDLGKILKPADPSKPASVVHKLMVRDAFGGRAKHVGMTALKGLLAGAALGGGLHTVRSYLKKRKEEKKKTAAQDQVDIGKEAMSPEEFEGRFMKGWTPEKKKAFKSKFMKTASVRFMGKFAQDEELPIQPEPEDEEGFENGEETPVDEFLDAQQALNEAEFFRERAAEAEEAAEAAQEQIQMLQDQLQQMQEQTSAKDQADAQQQQAMTNQAQMAAQKADMAGQDAVMARDESLQAQQQNIALRQAITSYRQQLMDLLAQDPTQMMPPPAVPEGPMPGMEGAPPEGAPPEEAPPEGGPPPAEGGPPGPPPGMAPPGPLPGPPGPPPGLPPPPAGPPAGPAAGPPPAPPAG